MRVLSAAAAAALLSLFAQPAPAEELSAIGVGITGYDWTCELDGAGIGVLQMNGSTYDIAGLDGAAIGSGKYRKGIEFITVIDGPLVDLYGIKTGVYGAVSPEQVIIFQGSESRQLTCRGTES